MVNQNVMRRGFCPGVWAPMASGDGLLVRVRARRARLEAHEIRGLSRAARSFGNGLVELTRRANLQIRGVSEAALPGLQAELVRLQLAAASPALERQPVLSVCPLAGLDPRCPPLEPVAEALEALLSSPELTRGLSDKFSVLLSGGSDLFSELDVDVRVQLCQARAGWAQLSIADGAAGRRELGACRSEDVARAVQALLVLLGATVPEHARMRQLLDGAAAGTPRTPGSAGTPRTPGGSTALAATLAPLLEPLPREAAWRAEYLGYHSAAPDSGRSWFGFELPFGSLVAEDWQAVAELAEEFGSGEVRLLPGRALVLADVRESDRERLAQRATARDFIVKRSVPWLRLVACSGAPACRSAHAETRQLASEFATLVRPHLKSDATLHVSGCEKGCAWSGAADITLVHGPDGSRIGFGASVSQTATTRALGLDAIRERLRRVPEGLRS